MNDYFENYNDNEEEIEYVKIKTTYSDAMYAQEYVVIEEDEFDSYEEY